MFALLGLGLGRKVAWLLERLVLYIIYIVLVEQTYASW